MNCPCGSGKTYAECCEPVVEERSHARTAEGLMRARYTAHVVGRIPFLRSSLAPEKRRDFDEHEVRRWATESEWLGLEIVSASENSEKGKVEFVARYRVDGKTIEYRERAKFRKDHHRGVWYFLDGKAHVREEGGGEDGERLVTVAQARAADKPGRNEPCPCGSGRKYKKCCGVA